MYFVYVMASINRTIYIGVTNNLARRVYQHKSGLQKCFTQKYKVHRLVYFEYYFNVNTAIAREKEIKKWRREKKVRLIEDKNKDWQDLSCHFEWSKAE